MNAMLRTARPCCLLSPRHGALASISVITDALCSTLGLGGRAAASKQLFCTATAARSSGGGGTGHKQHATTRPHDAEKPTVPSSPEHFDNPAAVLRRANEIVFEESPQPLPAQVPHGHVRVAMKAVGICGSDLHYVRHGRMGPFVVNAPMVLGHEGAGQVVAVGEGALQLVL